MAVHTPLLHRLDALNAASWQLFSFELPLLRGGRRLGLVLCINEKQAVRRWCEISPLPGRSAETLEEARDQVVHLLTFGEVTDILPSVQFGLESLLYPIQLPTSIPLYALLSGTPDQVVSQAESAHALGHTTIKLKVSPFSIPAAQEIIHTLKKQFRIRIDCNSAFSFEEAISLFSPFDLEIFDYIEDPTYELDRLSKFPYPFALDETADRIHTLPIHTYSQLCALVLKPTVLGGAQGCASLINVAKKHSLKITLSSSFESGLGLLQIAALAQRTGLTLDPLGLDTQHAFAQDLLLPEVHFHTPHLHVDKMPQVRTELLTEIHYGKMPHC